MGSGTNLVYSLLTTGLYIHCVGLSLFEVSLVDLAGINKTKNNNA